MSRIALLTSHITKGAAVSTDVLGMRAVLERHGYEARVYAESWDLQEPNIWSATEIADFIKKPDDILIYHHSIGWAGGLELLRNLKCKTVIKYHNITPSRFFSGISEWHEQKCQEGRRQLEAIAGSRCDLYLSDSNYNQLELVAAGVDESNSFIVPPFHEIDSLRSIEADMHTLDAYRDVQTTILSVSRVAPHKGVTALIEAFAAYHHDYNQNSRLLIVGREEEVFETYTARLREMLKFFVLEDAVVFAGEISDAALKACYLLANVFASASEHEGFCVPLIEAMAMKVPIVSYDSAAIPETVGDAGVLLDDRIPNLMAESINLLVSDEAVNVALGMAGNRRYEEHFTNSKTETKFLQALRNLN